MRSSQFPPGLPSFFIRAFTHVGDVIADPFLGAATTILAAAQTERRGVGTELLPKYVAVSLERLSVSLELTPEKL